MKIVHWSRFEFFGDVRKGVPAVEVTNYKSPNNKLVGTWVVPFAAATVCKWEDYVYTATRKAVVVYADVPVEKVVVIINGEYAGDAADFTEAELVDICTSFDNGLLVLGGITAAELEGVCVVTEVPYSTEDWNNFITA